MLDPDSIRLLIAMLVLVVFSAYFSATETAFSSFNRIRIKNAAENGDKRAAQVLRLSENYDRLLSAILVGNNIVNILLTTLATVFFVKNFGENKGATLATVITTVVVLIFGEISPKSLAKDHADRFAITTAPLLQGVVWLLTPINWLFSLWKKLLSRLFRTKADDAVTEDELLTIVDEAEQGGSLNEQESELIHRVISFNDREAGDILIPRVSICGIDADATYEALGAQFATTRYSRLPVYEDTIDRVVGVVHLSDYAANPGKSPRALMRPAVFVPPTVKIRLLLKQLQQEKTHMAIVTDEYGGTRGIVTMEDILEELVGDIWDEHDEVVEPFRETPEGTLVLCSAELTALIERFDMTETDCDAATVSGWVMETLGRIPAVGDTFAVDGLTVTVTKVDATRPTEILLSRDDRR